MAPKPCLVCGRLSSGSRCLEHERERNRIVQRSKRAARPYTTGEKKRRADAVAQWRQQFGDVCPGWEREPHPSSDLTADHVRAVGAGGAEGGVLRVLCRQCNSARGARP
jgi:hypothetical protein